MSKLTQHPKQFICHYDGWECFAVTILVWEPELPDVVQIHHEYYSKCTPCRLSHIGDFFEDLQILLREQGVFGILAYSKEWNKKFERYLNLFGFYKTVIIDDLTFGYKEI